MAQPTLPFDPSPLLPGSRVCVAVSGGADSVALLSALNAGNGLPHQSLGVGLSAVHIHHGLRGVAADQDADFVQALCQRLTVPLRIVRVDVAGRRQTQRETLEEAARATRYEAFRQVLAENADDLLTAHTLDDQAETVLMKLLRGAWTEGLGGIHPRVELKGLPGKRILRPLLGTRRAEVEAFLRGIGQDWREDETNLDQVHTRNRLRHSVLPLLRAENPLIDQTLAQLSELARDEETRWQAELDRLLPQILLPGSPVRGGGRAVSSAASASISIEIERLRVLDTATRRRVLRSAVRSLSESSGVFPSGISLTFDETARILALCGLRKDSTVPAKPGAVLHLRNRLMARRSLRELKLEMLVPEDGKNSLGNVRAVNSPSGS